MLSRLRSLFQHRVLRWGVLVVGALALSVAASWPLAFWSGAVFPSSPDMPDLNVSLWLPWHLKEQLLRGASPFDAPIVQYPHGQRISLLVWNLAIQALQVPLYMATDPVQAYNLSLVALGAGNALGGYVLGRALAPSHRAGAVLAAVLLATSPYAWNELTQGRVEQGFIGPFAVVVAGLMVLQRTPARRTAVLTGLAWGLAGLCYWFHGYFLVLLVGVMVGVAVLRRQWTRVRALAEAGAVAAVVAAPSALVLIAEAMGSGSVYRQSTAADPELVARLAQISAMASLGVHHSALWWASPPQLLRDVLPVCTIGLVLVGLVRAGGSGRWLAGMAVGGLVLALGPVLQWEPGQPLMVGAGSQLSLPMTYLQWVIPGFSRLWWPYRFQVFWVVGAAGCGAALLQVVRGARGRWGLALALGAMALIELRVAQVRTAGGLIWDQPRAVAESALFAELAAQADEGRSEPVLFLPYQGIATGRVLWQAVHHQPMSIGLGDSDDMLLTTEVLEHVAADPVLAWLRSMGRREAAAPPPLQGAALRAHLRGLGYRWAVVWAPAQPGVRERYSQALGGGPDRVEDLLIAWEL